MIRIIGKTVALLSLVMVLLTASIVILRYGFHWGAIAMQEAVIYCHAAIITFGAAYTLQRDQHVRVDVFYRDASAKHKAWVNLFGHLFLLIPLCCVIFYFSWDYVTQSWRILERSRQSGGLPMIFIFKSFILVLPTLLTYQATVEVFACVKQIRQGQPS